MLLGFCFGALVGADLRSNHFTNELVIAPRVKVEGNLGLKVLSYPRGPRTDGRYFNNNSGQLFHRSERADGFHPILGTNPALCFPKRGSKVSLRHQQN